jgi:hypothetical protein
MIIEVNTKLLDVYPELNSNQLLFLSMVLDKNQKSNQDVRKLVSLMSDDDISYLIEKQLVTSMERGNSIVYEASEKLKSFMEPPKDYFDLFYDMYPVYVVRPDGAKAYLRANVNKCRHLYNTYVGNSSAMAEHINKCLEFELEKKSREGKVSYMKTMWRWLVDHQWETAEEEMRDTAKPNSVSEYGQELI